MKVLYQLVEIKKYGKNVIWYESNKYTDIVEYLSEIKPEHINTHFIIQQATVIKNKV